MLSCSQLKVFQQTYDLLILIYQSSPNVDRDCRHTLVEKIKNDVMELCVLIYRANKAEDQETTPIEAAREMLVRIDIECKMLGDLRQISTKLMAKIAMYTQSIDEQIEVWQVCRLEKSIPN